MATEWIEQKGHYRLTCAIKRSAGEGTGNGERAA